MVRRGSIVAAVLGTALALAPTDAAAGGRRTAEEDRNALRRTMADEARRILASYDRHLEEWPGDPGMAIERCKFLDHAATYGISSDTDDEGLDDPSGEEDEEEGWGDCAAELEERFPFDPEVAVFALSRTWGERGITRAEQVLADPAIVWSEALKAQAYANLAWKQWSLEKFADAAISARLAMKLDDSLDLSLVVAKQLVLEDRRAEALEVLALGLRHEKQERLHAKAELLLELDGCELAAPLFERPELSRHVFLHARVLECIGDTAAAREKYELATPSPWQRQETRLRLFQLDLQGTDPVRAVASYEALRNLGWSADPFARHRLSLALKFPFAGWEARDLGGLAAFAGLLLFMGLLPLLLLVPVHYVGLLRRTHRGFQPEAGLRWKLRHVWFALAAFLVLDTLATFLFLPGELETMWLTESDVATHTLEALGRHGIFFFSVVPLAVLVLLRRRDVTTLLGNGGTHPAVTLVVGGTLAVSFFLALVTYIVCARALGVWEMSAAGVFELDRLTVLRAVRASLGVVPYLLLATVLVPIYEELLFRWVMLDGLARHVPFVVANLLQAVVFAALHQSLVLFLFFVAFAFVLGYTRRLSGGVLIGILAHAGYNGFASLLWILFGR